MQRFWEEDAVFSQEGTTLFQWINQRPVAIMAAAANLASDAPTMPTGPAASFGGLHNVHVISPSSFRNEHVWSPLRKFVFPQRLDSDGLLGCGPQIAKVWAGL